MKTIRLVAILSMYSVFALAQQKTAYSNSYRAGDKVYRQMTVDFPVYAKADSVWDYSNIKFKDGSSVVEYDTDAEREGTVAEVVGNTRYYYVQDSVSVRNTGYENNNVFADYDRTVTALRFPFDLGTTHLQSVSHVKRKYCRFCFKSG